MQHRSGLSYSLWANAVKRWYVSAVHALIRSFLCSSNHCSIDLFQRLHIFSLPREARRGPKSTGAPYAKELIMPQKRWYYQLHTAISGKVVERKSSNIVKEALEEFDMQARK
eukprot:2686027-Amphidinium_carterae.1